MKSPIRRLCAVLLSAALLVPGLSAPADATAEQVIRVGFFPFDGYHMTARDGTKSGYGYAYLQELAKFTNWTYDYVDCSWSGALELLAAGELDLVTSAQKTEDREADFLYSDYAIGTSSILLTVAATNRRYTAGDFAAIDGAKIGLLSGSSRNEQLRAYSEKKQFSYTAVYYDSSEAMSRALAAGEVDAMLTSNLRTIRDERVIAEFAPSPYYIICRKDNPALMQEINAALEQISIQEPQFQNDLYEKYYSVRNSGIAFSDAEAAYIQEHPAIDVLLAPTLAPMAQQQDGTCTGILPDLLQTLSACSGITLRPVYTETLAEYEAARAQAAPAVLACADNDPYAAEAAGYRLTTPYMNIGYSTLRRRSNGSGTTPIAAVRGTLLTRDFLRAQYGEENVILYDTPADCAQAVRDGDVASAVLSAYTAQQLILRDDRGQLQSSLISGYTESLCIAVSRQADDALFSILNKSVNSLDKNEVDDIVLRNTLSNEAELSLGAYLFRHPLWLLIGCCVIFLLLMLLSLSLFRSYRRRQKVLLLNESLRFGASVCGAYDTVEEINLQTGIQTRITMDDGQLTRTQSQVLPLAEVLTGNVHPEDRASFGTFFATEHLEALFADQATASAEFRVRTDKASPAFHWNEYTLQGMTPDRLHPRNLLLCRRNIQAQRSEEDTRREALRSALAAAQQSNAEKLEFLSRMSHEIRTPLNAILGRLTLMERRTTDEAYIVECAAKLKDAAKHLLKLTNAVLDISAIETEAKLPTDVPFQLGEQIASVCAMFHETARKKQIHFQSQMSNVTCRSLSGDPTHLCQILVALLSNAIRFTPSGGEVTLLVSQLQTHDDLVHFRFQVSDTGCGMSEKFLSRIGTPFLQASRDDSRSGGTGLSLCIAKNLVKRMNGAIRFKSIPERGTDVNVELPFRPAEDAATDKVAQAFSGLTALIADADETAGSYAALLLETCGIHCVRTSSAAGMQAAAKESCFAFCLVGEALRDTTRNKAVVLLRSILPPDAPIYCLSEDADFDPDAPPPTDSTAICIPKTLTLPMLETLLTRDIKPAQENRATGRDLVGTSILIAEDNELNLEIAVELLQGWGCVITTAENGREAVEKFRSAPAGGFDAILMDIQMPELDGHAATRQIRASGHPDAARIPIIAMTANAFAEDVSASLAAGMNEHVAKPVDWNMLKGMLLDLIRPHHT